MSWYIVIYFSSLQMISENNVFIRFVCEDTASYFNTASAHFWFDIPYHIFKLKSTSLGILHVLKITGLYENTRQLL